MTEQDAINALVGELEASDEQVEPQGSEPAEPQQTEHPQITQEKPKRRSRQRRRSFLPSSKRS